MKTVIPNEARRSRGTRWNGCLASLAIPRGPSTARRTAFAHAAASPAMTVLLLAFAFILASCSRGPVPEMKAREWRAWTLPPDGATMPTPRSLAVGPHDELALLDTAGRITIYDAAGRQQRQWQMLDVSVGKPEGIVILRDGRVIVCDTHYHRVVWFDGEGNWLKNIGREGRAPGEFIYPVGICKDPQENFYVCEYGGNDRVQKFSREGELLLEFGSFGTGPGQFQRPSGLTWREGKIYVTDAINNRVSIYSDAGKLLGLLGPPGDPLTFGLPYDIALDADGTLLVIEYGAGRLSRVSADGRLLGQLGHSGSGTGEFATPWGLIVDGQRRIHVADTKNRRVVTLRL
jgi:iron(III) transport system ATP-binding protein